MPAPLAASHYALPGNPRAVATDCDGTLLTDGEVTAVALEAISILKSRNIPLILVTGRAIGFAWTLFETLGADAVIAENGGLVFERHHPEIGLAPNLNAPHQLVPVADRFTATLNLQTGGWPRGREIFQELKNTGHIPQDTEPTFDVAFRCTDFTFPVSGLSLDELAKIGVEVRSKGADFVASTIHGHIMPRGQNKGLALLALLKRWQLSPLETITIGDSPNDEPLFDDAHFKYSFGVANISRYLGTLVHKPKYVSHHSEGWGFAEIIMRVTGQSEIFSRALSSKSGWENIIFIDSTCGLCLQVPQWLQRIDSQISWKIEPISGEIATILFGEKPTIKGYEPDAILVWSNGTLKAGAEAIIALLSSGNTLAKFGGRLFRLVPQKWQKHFYRMVANNRHRLWAKQ